MPLTLRIAATLAGAVMALLSAACAQPEDNTRAPDFVLPQRGTNTHVRLADFAGQIVVLDFFAYWCGPCAKASSELERSIAAHYADRGGNPTQIPVRVIAINVESAQPARTDAFIRKHRLSLVLDDEQGKTLAAYQGRGLPFIVVLDGTGATRERPVFRILYRMAGYEGTRKLRRLIDGVAPPPASEESRAVDDDSDPSRRRVARLARSMRDGGLQSLNRKTRCSQVQFRNRAWTRTDANDPRRPSSVRMCVHARPCAVAPGLRLASPVDPPLLLANHSPELTADGPDPIHAMIAAALDERRSGTAAAGPATTAPALAPEDPVGSGVPLQQRGDAEFEAMFASDVLLTHSGLGYGQTMGGTEWEIGVSLASMGFDYEPVSFDFLGTAEVVENLRVGGQLALRQRVFGRLSLLASAGAYDGFADFHSAWIDEYFRQQFGALPGYEEAAPRGANVQGGVRWEYLPASGFLQFEGAWLKDQIAPGYEIDFDGLYRGRPILYTTVWSLLAENVLTPQLRTQVVFRSADTTEREPRHATQGWLNYAPADGWVLRATGGYTTEDPTFEAWFVGLTIEREIAPSLWLSLSGRYYTDTGEIENSLFSTAAPGLRAWQAGVGARYAWGASTVRLYAAPYFTDYDPLSLGTAFFANLYRDRSWGLVQAAYHLEF